MNDAGSGDEAISHYQSKPYDCVVIDVEMPVLDGLTTTRHLCEIDPDALIVLISQQDDSQMQSAALAAGARAFLDKGDLVQLPALISSFFPNTHSTQH